MNPQGGIPFLAEVALLRGQAVVKGTARDQVKLGSGANEIVIGFAINDADVGQSVAIFPVNGGGKCKAIAGATFDAGKPLMLEGADGRVKEYAADNTLQYGCAIALEHGDDGQLVDVLPCFWMAETALA